MEVQVLEALQDSIISISVILTRSLGKSTVSCMCLDPIGLSMKASGSSFDYARSLLFVLCKVLLLQCVSSLTLLLMYVKTINKTNLGKFVPICNFSTKLLIPEIQMASYGC